MNKFFSIFACLMLFFAVPAVYAVDYPFADDMEGASNWSADSPWTMIDTDAHSPTHCWTDSPADYYANNADVSLTLSSSIDFSGTEAPQLKFWHKYQIEPSYDFGYVEISTDGGTIWTELATYSGTSGVSPPPAQWVREQIDLTGYIGESDVRIRFRLETDKSIVKDGWYIDDVVVAESPHEVDLAAPVNPTASSLDLSWTENLDGDFARYEVYRSTTPGVDIKSTLVGTITNQGTTNYSDTGLQQETIYYYRVFVFNTYDLYTGSKEVSGTTLPGVSYYSWDFEDGQGDWALDSPWAVTDESAHDGMYCLTDSPGGVSYANSIDKSATITINLATSTRPLLTFWHKYAFESYADFGYVEVSTDDGANWTRLFFATGVSADWRKERIDLSPYAGLEIYLRFHIVTNDSVVNDGWYIDDVSITENTATTPFPFYDDMEGVESEENWLCSSWWRTTSKSHSGSCSFTDSPGGNTVDYVYSPLTLAGTIDLTDSQNPYLTFWHRYSLYNNCYARVYVSTNGGREWTKIYEKEYDTQDYWSQEQLDLSDYMNSSQVVIRFRIEDTYTYGSNDGWYIDDVAIHDAPVNVTLGPPANITEHSMDLSWSTNEDFDFFCYEIYRSTGSGVDRSSDLIAAITDQSTTSYTDTEIPLCNTTYYYKVYVHDTEGLYNQGSNEVSGTTDFGTEIKIPPFTDDMETGDNWGNDLPWGLTTEDAHSGSHSWHDSPDGTYQNNENSSLMTRINLAASTRPLLTFWHKYAFESYADFGYVEVSTDDGANWTKLFFATGASADWRKERIDLSVYAGLEIYLRFHIVTNDSVVNDGWYIDDVSITENTATTPFPFYDDMEGVESEENWLCSSWWRTTSKSHSGSCSFTDSPGGNTVDYVYSPLTLAGTIDLTDSQNPYLTFWHRYSLYNNCYARVYVSTNGGREWTKIYEKEYDTQDYWSQEQLDLSDYMNSSQVVIRFRIEDTYTYGSNDGWYIDDVAIHDAPVNVTLGPPANITEHSMDLSWSTNEDFDFFCYEIYRSTGSGVDRSSDLIAAITDQSTTSYTDTEIPLCNTTYYYKVYVHDTEGLYNQGSNEVSGTTDFGTEIKIPPFTDDMETGDNWGNDLPWGLTTEDAHSGSHSWHDSPDGTYQNNENSSLMTRINLAASTRPLLTFWHKYAFESYADFGYVEVSTDDGANWTKLFFATGASADWRKERIDLSVYAGLEIYLRFHIVTNDSVVNDGWYIDDVSITENTATTPFPFYDDMEGVESEENWLCSSWWRTTSKSHSGSCSFTDSPGGNTVDYVYSPLTLAGTIDLTDSQNPYLTFWHRYSLYNNCYARVYVSTNGGREWTKIYEKEYDTQDYWSQEQLDLSDYMNSSQVVIRFRIEDTYTYGSNDGWYIDDVMITEQGIGPVNKIIISPDAASVLEGNSLQFGATGYDAEDNALVLSGVVWSVRGDIGEINADGLFTAAHAGVGAITATYDDSVNNIIGDISGVIEVVGSGGGITQNEQGNIYNSDSTIPGDDCILFNARITARPEDVLTQASPGCGYESGVWQVNVGNFHSGWSAGETLHIDFVDKCKGETGTLEYFLSDGGQHNDLTLSAFSFELITTPTTDVNVVTLLKDSAIINAEELVQEIPNAVEIAYWDSLNQAYVAHTNGSPLDNFPVHAGYPYFVTVTDPGAWTPTGTIPDPWPAFDLILSGTTNVNMIGVPFCMLRVTNAEELGHMIRYCTEIARWDTDNQAYEAHTYGAPLY